MLQAQFANGDLFLAASYSRQYLLAIKKKSNFYCPKCHEKVILKIGHKTTPHFAHFQTSQCPLRYGETQFHQTGKLQLYTWLKKQFTHVSLEKFLPSIKQRPDIYIKTENKAIAIEFQCARIPVEDIRHRITGYQSQNITSIWIIGANQLKRQGHNRFVIDEFTKQMIHSFNKHREQLIYYCPIKQLFICLSNILLFQQTKATASFTISSSSKTSFPQLFKHSLSTFSFNPKQWTQFKTQFRTRIALSDWHKRLYQTGLHLQNLPSLVYLPTSFGYLAKGPLWEWQTYFIVNYFYKIKINASFTLKNSVLWLNHFFHQEDKFPLLKNYQIPLESYLKLLIQLNYISEVKQGKYIKLKQVSFYKTVDQAIQSDYKIIYKLFKKNQLH